MTRRKVPETCAVCDLSEKASKPKALIPGWWCIGKTVRFIGCYRRKLPKPSWFCPKRGGA